MRIAVAAGACLFAALIVAPRGSGDDRSPLDPGTPEPFQVLQTIKTKGEVYLNSGLAFSPDSRVLAVADGPTIRFLDPRSGKEVADTWKFDDVVGQIGFPGQKTVAVVVEQATAVSVREYPSGKQLARHDLGKNQNAQAMACGEGTIVVASGGAPHLVRVLSGPEWRETWKVELPNELNTMAVALSPDRERVAASGRGTVLRVYAAKDGKLLQEAGRDKYVMPFMGGIAFSPDTRTIAFAPSTQYPTAERSDETFGLSLFDATFSTHTAIRWKPGVVLNGAPYGCAFTPDGRTLVAPCAGRQVALFEVATGRLRHAGGVPVPTEGRRFALSPDGRLFALGGLKRDVVVVDWRGAKPGAAPRDAAGVDALWADLASPDARTGFRAVVALGAAPDRAAKLIGEKLKPVPVPDAGAVRRWVADLGADDFATREAAEKELGKLGDAVAAELRDAARSDGAERRDRAAKLLRAASRADAADRLRGARAVEVLEYADSPESREILKQFAGGAAGARLTSEAKAALGRLEAAGLSR